MQSNTERRNILRLLVARVRDGRLERQMERVQKKRERSQSRNREKLFEQAREIARMRQANSIVN